MYLGTGKQINAQWFSSLQSTRGAVNSLGEKEDDREEGEVVWNERASDEEGEAQVPQPNGKETKSPENKSEQIKALKEKLNKSMEAFRPTLKPEFMKIWKVTILQ